MAFTPTAEYWANKLQNIRDGIARTEAAMAGLTEPRQIEAHEAQIASYKQHYAIEWHRFLVWRKNRQNAGK